MKILRCILELKKDEADIKEVDNAMLSKIDFDWRISADEFLAYATCIFYVYSNRDKKMTEENIVAEFLSRLHKHHPKRVVKEADFILEKYFPDLKK